MKERDRRYCKNCQETKAPDCAVCPTPEELEMELERAKSMPPFVNVYKEDFHLHCMADNLDISKYGICTRYNRSDLIPRPSLPPETVRKVKDVLRKIKDQGCSESNGGICPSCEAEEALALLEGV